MKVLDIVTSSPSSRRSARISLQVPLLVLVLAFTAIPVELRSLSRERLIGAFELNIDVPDIVANVAGYVPVGLVLASRGPWVTVGFAAGAALFAEGSQLFSKSRSPGLSDVASNVLGAIIGLVITSRWISGWRIRPPEFIVGRVTAIIAATLAVGYVGFGAGTTLLEVEEAATRFLAAPPWLDVNPRGSTVSGRLEARWTFEHTTADEAVDLSGNGLNGRLVNGASVTDGIDGRSLTLNGVNQYVDLGDPHALRFTGSETISAWIKASSFPVDDAAIVSAHSGLGYQLDTTVDSGPRTIGFKLANASGRLMARYGKTPLALNTWYHVAGVYDAQTQMLNVYLNGEKDNGCLLGTVTDRQYISGLKAYIGRRASQSGNEFAGSIDDVRIDSRALTQSEIEADIRAKLGARSIFVSTPAANDADTTCPTKEESFDSRTAGLVVPLGLLVATAILGLLPTISPRALCLASFAAGFLLVPTMAPSMPAVYKWFLPLLTLVGGASIASGSRVRQQME